MEKNRGRIVGFLLALMSISTEFLIIHYVLALSIRRFEMRLLVSTARVFAAGKLRFKIRKKLRVSAARDRFRTAQAQRYAYHLRKSRNDAWHANVTLFDCR